MFLGRYGRETFLLQAEVCTSEQMLCSLKRILSSFACLPAVKHLGDRTILSPYRRGKSNRVHGCFERQRTSESRSSKCGLLNKNWRGRKKINFIKFREGCDKKYWRNRVFFYDYRLVRLDFTCLARASQTLRRIFARRSGGEFEGLREKELAAYTAAKSFAFASRNDVRSMKELSRPLALYRSSSRGVEFNSFPGTTSERM